MSCLDMTDPKTNTIYTMTSNMNSRSLGGFLYLDSKAGLFKKSLFILTKHVNIYS